MIFNYPDGSKRLMVLDSFIEDRSLPKFKNRLNEKDKYIDSNNFNAIRLTSNSDEVSQSPTFVSTSGTTFNNSIKEPEKSSILNWFKSLFKQKPMDVERVFTLILKDKKEIDLVATRIEGFAELIRRAKDNGQEALVEKLQRQLPVKVLEQKLFVSEFKRFIDEQDLIKFAIKCEKGLKLSYMRNFIRPIPTEVSNLKKKADELEVFDNYVILHYDPDGKATEMTDKEKAKAKDPILFGLIRNSTKLYFIGDWKDEQCDLTFEEIAKNLSPDTETKLL